MSQTFQLTSAKILGDGLILRLQYEAGVSVGQPALNRLTDTGLADYLPGLAAGLAATVNGTPVEVIGIQAEEWNMPQPWLSQSGGGALPAGTYSFLVAIDDGSGHEVYVGPAQYSNFQATEVGYNVSGTTSLIFQWRVPCPPAGKVNFYAATSVPLYGSLIRVASIPAAGLTSPTSYTLKSFTGDNALFVPASVTWTVTCRLPAPLPLGTAAVVNAPAALVADEKGNTTAAVVAYAATNRSLVGTDGFLAVPENSTATGGTFSFVQTVYVSYSQGVDTVGNGTLAAPYKTVGFAQSQVSSAVKNVRFRLLRGDTFPADVWTRAYWGTGFSTPALFDSYWNPSYGPDPGARPQVVAGDPYYDLPARNLSANQSLFQQRDSTGQTKGNGDRPYTYFRGLAFLADPSFPNNYSAWPTLTIEDSVVISDCEFQNVVLVASYGAAELLAPINCMIHRSIIHSTHGSAHNTWPDTGSTGTSLVFPDRFINPWANPYYGLTNIVVPGQTSNQVFYYSNRWKVTGWKLTISEGANSETKTITAMPSFYQWSVDTPFVNTYTRDGCKLSLDPTGQQFEILQGTGAGSTVYTVASYNAATRTATVSPALPVVDTSSRIAFLPLGYWPGRTQGLFMAHCGDFLISQTTIDKCGWNWSDDTSTYNDVFCHNVYLQTTCRDVVSHGNYFLRSNSVGMQQRGGGVNAYNVVAENPQGMNMGGGGTFFKNIFSGQGLYNCTFGNSPSHLPFLIQDFSLVLKSHGSVENRVPGYAWNGITTLNYATNGYAHSYLAIRHCTYVDAGCIQINNRVPVPGTLQVRNNLIANRSVTGVDYVGQPLQNAYLSLAANWQNNGLASVPAVLNNQVDWDVNAHRITTQRQAFQWPDVTTNVFSTWQATGRDTHGLALGSDPSFVQGAYTLCDWAVTNGLNGTFDALWQTLRARPEGVWPQLNDTQACYNTFMGAYSATATSLPAADRSSLGYFGGIDNRVLSPATGGPSAYSVKYLLGPFAFQPVRV